VADSAVRADVRKITIGGAVLAVES